MSPLSNANPSHDRGMGVRPVIHASMSSRPAMSFRTALMIGLTVSCAPSVAFGQTSQPRNVAGNVTQLRPPVDAAQQRQMAPATRREGELPASPWAQNVPQQVQQQQAQQQRLRNSTQSQSTSVVPSRASGAPVSYASTSNDPRYPKILPASARTEVGYDNETVGKNADMRPAKVTLLRPLAPVNQSNDSTHVSNYPPSDPPTLSVTQQNAAAQPSGWHRVPEGGLVIQSSDDDESEVDVNSSFADETIELREAGSDLASRPSTSQRLRGLPDREDRAAMIESKPVSSAKQSSAPLPTETNTAQNKTMRLRSSGIESSEPLLLDDSGSIESQATKTRVAEARPSVPKRNPSIESLPPVEPNDPAAPTPRNRTEFQLSSEPMPWNASSRSSEPLSVAPTGQPKNDAGVPAARLALANQISNELLTGSTQPMAAAPEPLEPPPGWQNVRQELEGYLERCDSLLRRGAVHSAREEATRGLRTLFRTLDTIKRVRDSEQSFDEALMALREEENFHASYGTVPSSHIAQTVSAHSTPALKARDLTNLSPEIASQHYRAYARAKLVAAADGHPWAAELLYALGKTYEKEAEQDSVRATQLKNHSVVCYQAASYIAPGLSTVSNQLGFVLLQLDRNDEAYQALRASIAARPQSKAWQNLAEVYRRYSQTADAEYAVQQAAMLSPLETSYGPTNPEVTQVAPEVFAKYSPAQTSVPTGLVGSNGPATAPQAVAYQTPNATTNTSNASAKTSKSWFPKIFR